jgi:hypothetical protein
MDNLSLDIFVNEIDNKSIVYKDTYPRIKICYIILTCKKNLQTKVKWQKETCFRNTDPEHCYFLSCESEGRNIYGWNTADDYASCIDKYIQFFQNMDLDYDWYMFIDDDTFVFPKRIEQYLPTLDKSEPIYFGFRWSHIEGLRYMSGGAGFFLTKQTYTMLREFLKIKEHTLLRSKQQPINGDVTVGVWIREINRSNNYKIKLFADSNYLRINHHENNTDIFKCLTFHYVNEMSTFMKYNKYLEIIDNSVITPIFVPHIPKEEKLICFSPFNELKKGLRHYAYKVYSCNFQDNRDFYYIIKKSNNNTYLFQSDNFREHYLSPSNDGVFITNKTEDSLWEILPNSTGKAFNIKSLSKNPLWAGKFISINNSSVDPVFLHDKSETVLQDIYFYEIFEP